MAISISQIRKPKQKMELSFSQLNRGRVGSGILVSWLRVSPRSSRRGVILSLGSFCWLISVK